MGLLSRERAALVVVDVQEALPPLRAFERVALAARSSCEGARILERSGDRQRAVPEGPRPHRARGRPRRGEPPIEKTVFSAARAEGFDLHGREQAIVCGIETHVCVSQTVHDLLASGVEVHVPADAVGSRHAIDYERGLERMERAGAVIGTVEAVLFELLERAGTPEFKAVQKLIL